MFKGQKYWLRKTIETQKRTIALKGDIIKLLENKLDLQTKLKEFWQQRVEELEKGV